jgi:RND family efflux transporter MFP subunit
MLRFRPVSLAAVAALLAFAGCGGDEDKADAAPAGAAGARGGNAGGGGGRGGRGGSITLSASDVAPVRRASLEEGTPITGDLRPIETIQVRARLEGDIVAVLAREGQRVSEGQVLARFESTEQASGQKSAEARLASVRAELSTAEWNLQQSEELFKAGAVAERDLRTAQNAVASAKAQLAAAEAEVRTALSSMTDTRVLAPTSGTIEERTVETGEHVARGAALFTLVRSDVLELAASVQANRANNVTVNQPVRFTAGGGQFEGRVARVSPTINTATQSITVYVQVPNQSGRLKGGTFTTGRIVSRAVKDALVVPTTALRQAEGTGTPYVYRLEGTTVAQVNVQIGIVDEAAGLAQIVSGLADGDRIIVGNVGTLGRGMQVQIVGMPAASN